MAIKAVIFDCFGVLIIGGKKSIQHDFPSHKTELHDLAMRSDYGYITRDEFNATTTELTGLSAADFEARYWAKNVRNESAFEWVRALTISTDYSIGMLSNIGRGWLDDLIPEQERDELFTSVVLSGDVGMIKPAPELFALAAQRLGVLPQECVMIDDLLDNIDGASRAGMHGIVFDTTAQAQAELDRIVEAQRA